ncbi:hypothetical protein L0B53_13655 [Vibrio sp. SS-MA-C1-2]|uniref:hypothetical protein n=1 Tax=Vibrio sp. SS-MA-C1-2 TaxID=2908646 RepID=UPI001F39EBFE|nr:hypothetical protein [Vibrio sp. SS-MA-C1-2]UJF18062.1 hypothetical protein L0B53_13655 [Vibrio sp. SS-MA-C1-2]
MFSFNRLYFKSCLSRLSKILSTIIFSILVVSSTQVIAAPLQEGLQPEVPQIHATEAELTAVNQANSAYYNALSQQGDANWVMDLSRKGQLKQECYLSKTESVVLGKRHQVNNLDMTCVQLGTSTRIFWPTRWFKFCMETKTDLPTCMMQKIH